MIGMIFLDLKRAFKVVNREILIKKLQCYGLKRTVLEWFKSYLQNRSQRVKFYGILSDLINIQLGVPQGSVLESLLFLLYINDMIDIINNKCILRLFADDALIYCAGHSIKKINNILNIKMSEIGK